VTPAFDACMSLREVQDATGTPTLAPPRRYDRAQYNLDRAGTYAMAS
jgi:hypothetical protein